MIVIVRPDKCKLLMFIVHAGSGLNKSGQFSGAPSFEASVSPSNPFLSSTAPGDVETDGGRLATIGTDAIFREVDERESLSKVIWSPFAQGIMYVATDPSSVDS